MAEGAHARRIRAGIDAFNRGDVEGVLALVSEDVEWKRVDGLPDEGGRLHGRDAVREFLQPEVFERMSLEPVEIVEEGDTVLIRGRVTALGAASGIELEVDSFIVYRLEGDLARSVENYRKREDAERASGLRFG